MQLQKFGILEHFAKVLPYQTILKPCKYFLKKANYLWFCFNPGGLSKVWTFKTASA